MGLVGGAGVCGCEPCFTSLMEAVVSVYIQL